MRIAIVHYHLQIGGVRRTIENTVRALRSAGVESVVLTGEPPNHEWNAPIQVVPGLAYEERRDACSAESLAGQMVAAARQAFRAVPHIWHVHNHSLGKNLAVPEALCRLAQDRHRLLLQIHDFAEDGRPANYRRMLTTTGEGDIGRLSRCLYPNGQHVHYAVLNARDHANLRAAGLSPDRLHILPNPVAVPSAGDDTAGDDAVGDDTAGDDTAGDDTAGERGPERRLWLYPTRAIRRKNLGEFLLWAAVDEREDRFATTQGPKNPVERPGYERWRSVADSLHLPVDFEVGARGDVSFASLLRSAHAMVTTSIAEGFGMAFLEPWLAGRGVAGRNLTDITAEFSEAGVDLSMLYDRLEAPVAWVGIDAIENRARQALAKLSDGYGRTRPPDDVPRALAAIVREGRVDVGRLDEPLQERILRRVVESRTARQELSPRQLWDPTGHDDVIDANRSAILRNYGLESYGSRLIAIYRHLLSAPAERLESLSGETLLDQFLAPERLWLLRT